MAPTDRATALVTGAGRGIGRAVALALAGAGHPVALVSRTPSDLDGTARAISGAGGTAPALSLPADVTDREALQGAFRRAEGELGPVGILVHGAGIAESAPFPGSGEAHLRRHLEVNLVAAHALASLAWPGMAERGRGHIIPIASTAGLEGYAYTSSYTASKHALVGLTRALAREAAPRGIRVNAVCPGFVDTPMLERSVERIMDATGRSREEARSSLGRMNRGGRLLQPEEVAGAVLWLLSEEARDLNGEAVVVDGRPGPWDSGSDPPLPVNPVSLGEARGYSNGMLMRPGRTLFVAGQVAWNARHEIVGPGDFPLQFDTALGNVLEVVREAGGGPESIGRMRIYVSDRTLYNASLKEVGRAYRKHMGRHYPAMALVEVRRLLEEGALVEIEAEAIL